MKISTWAFIFVSIFIFTVKVEGSEEESETSSTGDRGLRGVVAAEHAEHAEPETVRKLKEKGGGGGVGGGPGGGSGGLWDEIGWTNSLGMVTWASIEPTTPWPTPPRTPWPTPTSAPLSAPSFVSAPITDTSTTVSRSESGPCAGGSVFWDAVAYPLWADAMKCTNSSVCLDALVFSSCCMVNFCFCTGYYGFKGECVA